MSSAAPSSTPSSVAMLQPTSATKKLKCDAMGSTFKNMMRHTFRHGETLFEYLEEQELSYTCTLFRTNLLPLIIKRNKKLVELLQKHYDKAVLACGMWDHTPPPYSIRFVSLTVQQGLYDMIHMYNADVSINMLRGTEKKAMEDEFIEEWAHVQLFFRYLFGDDEEVTDLSGANRFLVKHKFHFQAEYERVQRKHAVDLTSDEE
jgi:hypothetical protein